MEIFLAIMAVVLSVAGIIGSVIPVIPGVILGYGGLLCAFFRSGSHLSQNAVWIWLAISVAVCLADYFLPALMTRLFGGSRSATVGAMVGLIAGVFLTPIGMVAGTLVGAMAGQLIHDREFTPQAIKAAFGSFLSFVVGTGLKLTATVAMFVFTCRDLFPTVTESVQRWF